MIPWVYGSCASVVSLLALGLSGNIASMIGVELEIATSLSSLSSLHECSWLECFARGIIKHIPL